MVWALQEWMGISWWRRAFLTTFDWNNDWKCGNSLTMKAMCIRNLFHQDRRWMENSTVTFWSHWRKTFGANVQTSGMTTPGPCIMIMLRLTHRSLWGSFWLLRRWQSSSILTGPSHLRFFPISENETEAQGAMLWEHWRDPDWIAGCDEDTDVKWLPALLPIMEILLGSLYQCQRGWGANINLVS